LAFAFREPVFENNQIISKGQKNLITNQAVIKEIDIREKDKVKLKLGSQYIYKTDRNTDQNHYYCPINFLPPKPVIDKKTAVNIRECLEMGEMKTLSFYGNQDNEVILPIVPESYIRYSYSPAPYITYRGDAELELTNRI